MSDNDTRIEVHFTAYNYERAGNVLFQFYTYDGTCWNWDEDKLTTEEALAKYPLEKYMWVSIRDCD